VGDQAFQAKCVDRIMRLKRAGRVLICISHAMETLRSLCSRAVWLDHGQVMGAGPVSALIGEYERSVAVEPRAEAKNC
jgi:lipopolysaccharide transport system ATP-binding protein